LNDWPPNSPDLNIVENAWSWIARKLVGKVFRDEDDLWEGIKEAWEGVPQSFIRSLWDSIPRKLEAVRRSKGQYTRS
jgi:transposase